MLAFSRNIWTRETQHRYRDVFFSCWPCTGIEYSIGLRELGDDTKWCDLQTHRRTQPFIVKDIISDFILFMCYHDANLQYFQFSSHHITETGELPGSWLIGIKNSWGCWLYGIFMKFSPAYDNENISQCANIILRHDRWVDTQIQDSKSPVGTLCTLLWHSRLTNTSFCCDGTEWKD